MATSQQALIHQHSGVEENGQQNIIVDASRFVTLAVCFRVVYLVFSDRGLWLGIISAILTAICVTPLFNSPMDGAGRVLEGDTQEQNQSSHIFTEALEHELNTMQEEEHSAFGRRVHQGIEFWSHNIDALVYAAQVVRENQGLVIVLAGGISSMMMALIAGLDVNVLKAFLLSLTCYVVTTLLVVKSSQRIVNGQILQNGESKLSSEEVTKIIDAIPEENFVPNVELENCDLLCIENMLGCRGIKSLQKANTGTEDSGCAPQDVGAKKKSMLDELRQRRNYNYSCCICLSTFERGEKIRVLSRCHHEFHRRCIDQWAETFAANERRSNCNTKRGKPTCPLCKTCLGEAQEVCHIAEAQRS